MGSLTNHKSPITNHRLFLPSAPAVILAASLLLGCLVGRFTQEHNPSWIPAAVPVIGIMAIIQPSPIALAAAGFSAGLALETIKISNPEEIPELWGRELTLRGEVIKKRPSIYGQSSTTLGISEALGRVREPVNFTLRVDVPEDGGIVQGTDIMVRSSLKRGGRPMIYSLVHGRTVPGGWKSDPTINSPVIRARERFSGIFRFLEDSPATGILAAISLGERWRVDVSTRDMLRKTGTYHLLAVSGVHVAASILPFVFLARLFTSVTQLGRPHIVRVFLLSLIVCAVTYYIRFTGISASALRASIYLLLAGSAVLARRSPSSFTILSWCFVGIVSFGAHPQPDLSLLLSALAVTGIILSHSDHGSLISGALRMTLGAVLFTLPVAVWVTGGISAVAPLGNIAAGLPFGLILIPAAVLMNWAALFQWIPLKPLINVWLKVTTFVLEVLSYLAGLPISFLHLSPLGCLTASLGALGGIVVWHRKSYRLGTGIAVFLCVVGVSGTVHFIGERSDRDQFSLVFPGVGQADIAIVRHGGKTVLVDCGPEGVPGLDSAAVRALRRMGIRHIDAVFISHNHPDHAGGLRGIMALWPVDALYVSGPSGLGSNMEYIKSTDTQLRPLCQGDGVMIGSLRFQVLGPEEEDWSAGDLNRLSLQLLLEVDGFRALFTGDAGWDQVVRSLNMIGGLDLLKVPHHGSKEGFPPPGLDDILKRIRKSGKFTAVCSSQLPGKGHLPAREVVRWFERKGVNFLFTGNTGVKFRYKIRGSAENGSTVVDNHYRF